MCKEEASTSVLVKQGFQTGRHMISAVAIVRWSCVVCYYRLYSLADGATDDLKQSPMSYVVNWFSERQGVALWKIVLTE